MHTCLGRRRRLLHRRAARQAVRARVSGRHHGHGSRPRPSSQRQQRGALRAPGQAPAGGQRPEHRARELHGHLAAVDWAGPLSCCRCCGSASERARARESLAASAIRAGCLDAWMRWDGCGREIPFCADAWFWARMNAMFGKGAGLFWCLGGGGDPSSGDRRAAPTEGRGFLPRAKRVDVNLSNDPIVHYERPKTPAARKRRRGPKHKGRRRPATTSPSSLSLAALFVKTSGLRAKNRMNDASRSDSFPTSPTSRHRSTSSASSHDRNNELRPNGLASRVSGPQRRVADDGSQQRERV